MATTVKKLTTTAALEELVETLGKERTAREIGVSRTALNKWLKPEKYGDRKPLAVYWPAIRGAYLRYVDTHARAMVTSFMPWAAINGVTTDTLIRVLLDAARVGGGCQRCVHSRATTDKVYFDRIFTSRACAYGLKWPDCPDAGDDRPRYLYEWLLSRR